MQASEHYDEAYFRWQSRHAGLRGEAERFKFAPFLRAGDRIVDFGCGDGALLAALGGGTGIEINPHAAEAARRRGLTVVRDIAGLADGSADLVVSNHALEHVEDPVGVLRQMHRVLSPGGRVVIVVPCDRPGYPFRAEDRDMHLFSWSANNLGNALRVAGFAGIAAGEIVHRWPPGWQVIATRLGWAAFHASARAWGRLSRGRSQVRATGTKPGRA